MLVTLTIWGGLIYARPVICTGVDLAYPEGRPDLAHPSRVRTWAAAYVGMGIMMMILFFTIYMQDS